jgi:predicted AlkP superfamily pyrophosphatase or phosphodiesterase
MTLPRLVLLLVAAAASAPSAWSARQAAQAPRLVVILVVDQMRFDYLDRMAPHWTHGLKRLLNEGAVFEQNAYPYLQTVTCAGHATIGTGSFPATHGIILNAWWRGTRNASCTEDTAVTAVGYEPGTEPVGHSSTQLLVPTLADRLRGVSPDSRVVTLSTKPRSAIMLAGKSGVVTWLDERNWWATSTAFTATPDPDVQAFISAHPRAALRNVVWDRIGHPSIYTGEDAGIGERPLGGWTSTFPHPLAGAAGTDEAQFYVLWEYSPFSDTYLGELAADLLKRKRLGQGPAVDFLGVSFPAVDLVGHKFGPASHEVQDTLLRLDVTIGRLLDTLDQHVGRGRYLVGLSADHGVADIPEATQARGEPAGRVSNGQLLRAANEALAAALGPGQHAVRAEYTQLYLSAAAQQQVVQRPEVASQLIAALEKIPGVERVVQSAGLDRERSSPDEAIRAAALSYVPGRSGQFVIILEANYVNTPDATTHGTHRPYDQKVPLIFFGAGVKPGRYGAASTPADLAPTLAWRIGVPLPGADGVARAEAFVAQ